jgi:hypothetical protein
MTEHQQDSKQGNQRKRADLGRRFGEAPDPARLGALRASLAAEAAPAIPEPARTQAKAPAAATAMLSARIPPMALRQLKILAAEEGLSMQDLVCEALDMLFKARGRAPLAR